MDDVARLAAWLVFAVLMIAISYAGRVTQGKPDPDILYRWSTAASGVLQDGIVLLIVLAIAGFSTRLLALRRPRTVGGALRLIALAFVAIYAFEYLYSAAVGLGNEQGLTPSRWDGRRAGAYVVNALVITTWVPFVEELAYRGVGYSLLERFGRWPAIVAVGLLFGLAHGLVLSLPVIAAFGGVLAWVRARTGSVVPAMVLHAVFNLVALVVAVAL